MREPSWTRYKTTERVEKTYKYRLGKRVVWTSALYIVAFAGVAVALAFIYEGGYIFAWYISLILAVLALMILSIPRKVVLADDGIEIHCISDYTLLKYEEIASIRKVEKSEMQACLPIFGALGFFGHYGRFINLQSMDIIHIYASRWGHFVEITDIDNDKYYISCEEADELISHLKGVIRPHDIRENI